MSMDLMQAFFEFYAEMYKESQLNAQTDDDVVCNWVDIACAVCHDIIVAANNDVLLQSELLLMDNVRKSLI